MLRALLNWFKTDDRDPAPRVLVRLSGPDNEEILTCEMSAVWFPSGRVIKRSVMGASGLFMMVWQRGQRRAEITFTHHLGEAYLEVDRDRQDPERVVDLKLAPPTKVADEDREDDD